MKVGFAQAIADEMDFAEIYPKRRVMKIVANIGMQARYALVIATTDEEASPLVLNDVMMINKFAEVHKRQALIVHRKFACYKLECPRAFQLGET